MSTSAEAVLTNTNEQKNKTPLPPIKHDGRQPIYWVDLRDCSFFFYHQATTRIERLKSCHSSERGTSNLFVDVFCRQNSWNLFKRSEVSHINAAPCPIPSARALAVAHKAAPPGSPTAICLHEFARSFLPGAQFQ